MPSHFSTIGMPVETPDDMTRILEKAAENAREIVVASGRYLNWASDEGAELWLQIDNDDNLVGVTPYFRGKAVMRAALSTQIARADDTPFEGAVHAWANPQGDELESGDYPFVFDLADKARYGALDFPFTSPVHLAAFAHELNVYDSDAEHAAAQQDEPRFASESFIPSGLFGADQPQPYAFFSGHVLDTGEPQNPLTGEFYRWIRVSTLGGEIDIVCDPQLLQKPPVKTGVIQGSFWLCGRILQPKFK